MQNILLKPFSKPIAQVKTIFARKLGFLPTTETDTDDIFIVGYPKSGNTWMQNMTAAILYGINLEWVSYDLVNSLVPDTANKFYRRFHTPMCFKTHLQPASQFKRVVYLVRDGRDTIVSFYHHRQGVGRPATMDELIQNSGAAKIPYGTWQNHVSAWLANPFQAPMIVIRYEDLKRDPVTELKRFCDFAGLERDTAFLKAVVETASFDKMKERESRYGIHIKGWQPSENHRFIRKGKVGGYTDEMSPETLKLFMSVAGDLLHQLNYE